MVQLNLALREINCKVVYFGCGLGGKTTNLEQVHAKAQPDSRGELTSIATESDRTLFFDFMPLDLGTVSGMRVKFQLYTVPGQVYYNSTRKLVLRGADGVIFVADSQRSKLEENIESLDNLEECLKEQGRELDEMPHVIQYNKRDLDEICSFEELDKVLNRYGAQAFEAVASAGDGVTETFKALVGLMLEKVKAMSTESSAKPTVKAQQMARSTKTPHEPVKAVTNAERLQGGLAATADPPKREPVVDNRPITSSAPAASLGEGDREPAAQSAAAVAVKQRTTGHQPVQSTTTGHQTIAPLGEKVAPSIRKSSSATPLQGHARPSITTGGMRAMGTGMMVSTSGRRRKSRGSSGLVWVLLGLLVVGAAAAAYFFWL